VDARDHPWPILMYGANSRVPPMPVCHQQSPARNSRLSCARSTLYVVVQGPGGILYVKSEGVGGPVLAGGTVLSLMRSLALLSLDICTYTLIHKARTHSHTFITHIT
jgi:hypothetical protein